ncbi:MAG TPA: response regulator transcription factor [Microthrixaceae bacterium]|nr:response regulator transcription factor [Microthrixaceae bacterium]HMV74934.1 response regulator transcription factor [Microthrixaceae bacterium]HMX08729.1 response regulator transcription factor [Microthrixaceae bacterium]HMX66801.1 response regulator transcription factor [Microthrixaceae bacterium]HMY87730.1 response regulator transcription factor [Microthrixaceae bacterium]
MATIVAVEDDPAIADLLDMYLRREDHRVYLAADGERGLELIAAHRPDVVILDVGLPGIDGLEVCRRIRASDAGVSVVFLTARDDEIDRVLGLEMGADDYVTKPFSPRELVARVRAQLRRAAATAAATTVAPAVIEVGSVEVDLGRHEARRDGEPVGLTTQEFELLAFLGANRGLALSRRQILDGAWGDGWIGDERTVDVHVGQLRRKLGDDLPLVTVWGVGYRLD